MVFIFLSMTSFLYFSSLCPLSSSNLILRHMSRSELSLDDASKLRKVKTIVVSPGVDLSGVLQTQVVDP